MIAGNSLQTNTFMEEGVLEKIIVVERFLEMAPSSLNNNSSVIKYLSSLWHSSMLTESFHIESEPLFLNEELCLHVTSCLQIIVQYAARD